MRMIKELAGRIYEELEGAEDYINLAERNRGHNDALADMYVEIAAQEMTHVEKLHGKVVEIITAWRHEQGDPPRQMAAIWEHEHKKMIKRSGEVKAMLEMAHRA